MAGRRTVLLGASYIGLEVGGRKACLLWVIRCRSLRDENRSMSATPRKRRLAVKASSVAMGQQRTPAVHTGSEKRLNPPGDLLGGFELQVHRRLPSLAHPPDWQALQNQRLFRLFAGRKPPPLGRKFIPLCSTVNAIATALAPRFGGRGRLRPHNGGRGRAAARRWSISALFRVHTRTALVRSTSSRAGAEGKSDRGGSSAAGPRAHVDLDPAEIRGVASGRLS